MTDSNALPPIEDYPWPEDALPADPLPVPAWPTPPPVLAPPVDDWPPLDPIAEVDRPAFPLHCLPPRIRDMVDAVSIAMQTPPDLAAGIALGLVGGAIQGAVQIESRPGWTEPTNLYVATFLGPGNRKSGVFVRFIAPFHEFEKRREVDLKAARARAVSQKKVIENQIHAAEVQMTKSGDSDQTLDRLVDLRQRAENIIVPPPFRLLADDTTAEQLATIMVENAGRMIVASAEGGFFANMFGRYSDRGVANLEIVLKAHPGDPVRIDRRGRAEAIDHPALTLVFAVQPDVLESFAENASARGRGFHARFLYSIPESPVGQRNVAPPPVDGVVQRAWNALIHQLLAVAVALSPSDCATVVPHVLRFDPAAGELLMQFERGLEMRLGEGRDLHSIVDWAAKLAGHIIRIAGILHVAAYGLETPYIDAETYRAAEEIGLYYLAHARRAFGTMTGDGLLKNAQCVLRWIEIERSETLTARDVMRAYQGRFETISDVAIVLDELENRGYIRRLTASAEKRKRGRPPSQAFEVNPGLRGSNPETSEGKTNMTKIHEGLKPASVVL